MIETFYVKSCPQNLRDQQKVFKKKPQGPNFSLKKETFRDLLNTKNGPTPETLCQKFPAKRPRAWHACLHAWGKRFRETNIHQHWSDLLEFTLPLTQISKSKIREMKESESRISNSENILFKTFRQTDIHQHWLDLLGFTLLPPTQIFVSKIKEMKGSESWISEVKKHLF